MSASSGSFSAQHSVMRPVYKHDCPGCRYLATVHGGDRLVDWYLHDHAKDHVEAVGLSMVGRYSSEPSENVTPYFSHPLTEFDAGDGRRSVSQDALIAWALWKLSSSGSSGEPR